MQPNKIEPVGWDSDIVVRSAYFDVQGVIKRERGVQAILDSTDMSDMTPAEATEFLLRAYEQVTTAPNTIKFDAIDVVSRTIEP